MFDIQYLGENKFDSPLHYSNHKGDNIVNYVKDSERIIYDPHFDTYASGADGGIKEPASICLAGPREKIYFDPKKSKAATIAPECLSWCH